MNSYKIDGIHFEIPSNMEEMQDLFFKMIGNSKNKQIINFVNPEIFLAAKNDSFLYNHLVNAKYNFIDGIGLLMLINKELNTTYTVSDRYTGTDFFTYLQKCKYVKLFLYGATLQNNELACNKISEKYNNVSIVGNIDGYTQNLSLVSSINESEPDILVVCLGCPKQEKWIDENFNSLDAKVIFGNGGAIDFWSENVKRAPEFFIRHNLEWLFRLFQDFNCKRIKRQLRLVGFVWNMKKHKYKVEKV